MNNDNPTTMSQPHVIQRQSERRGGKTVPYTKMYPLIRGGQCDFCGTLDKDVEAVNQYKLCPHFRGFGNLECSYCDGTKNPDEVIRTSVMKVHDHPSNKDGAGNPTLVVVCDSYECSQKHEARFDASK